MKKILSSYLVGFICLANLFSISALGQPANDNCTGAIPLTVSTSYNPISGTNVAATSSILGGFCSDLAFNNSRDVWYSFIAQTGSDTIIVTPTSGMDPVVEWYTGGSCSGISSMNSFNDCANTTGNPGAQERLVLPYGSELGEPTIAGTTIYVRVYGNDQTSGTFTIAAKRPANPGPGNDKRNNPKWLTINPICNSEIHSNEGSTPSLPSAFQSCSNPGESNDVWFVFTASGPGDSIIVSPIGNFNPILEVMKITFGPGSTTNITLGCSNGTLPSATERVSPGNLTTGSVYYVRVYGQDGGVGSFSICGKSRIGEIINDNCLNAIDLTSSMNCIPVQGTTIGALQEKSPFSCGGSAASPQAKDVWFSFTTTGTGDSIIVTPSGNFDAVVEFYGSNCNSNETPLGCSDNPTNASAIEKICIGGQIGPRGKCRVRVYGWGSVEGNFSICIKRGSETPFWFNDNCADAQVLTPDVNSLETGGTTSGATPSTQISCAGGAAEVDVWYVARISSSGPHAIKLMPFSNINLGVQIFKGSSCTNLVSLACLNKWQNGNIEDTIMNFTAGDSLFFRVFQNQAAEPGGLFGITLQKFPTPANDECSTATVLTPFPVCQPLAASSLGALESRPPITCGGRTSTAAADVWFRFVASSISHRVTVASRSKFDPVIEVLTGSACATMASVACVDDSASGGDESILLTNLNPGQTYFVRVYSFAQSSPVGDFTICLTAINCNPVAGTASVNIPSITSNGKVILNVVGRSPGSKVQWQISKDNGQTYQNEGPADALLPDTLFMSSATTKDFFARAIVSTPTCYASTSVPLSFRVNCATPFQTQNAVQGGRYIANVAFNTISNASVPVIQNGSYENFTNLTTTLCRGLSYPLQVSVMPSASAAYTAVWIDFNNNGSFGDAGENVFSPTQGTGVANANVLIPNSAPIGSVKMRIMVYEPGTAAPSANPCAPGPYLKGEIEEYTLNIAASPTTANAGQNAPTCSPVFTLAGNNPTVGSGTWSLISGTGTFSNASSPTSAVSNLSVGANVFRWTITNACTSSVSEVTITYSPAQTALAGSDQILCANNAQVSGNPPAGTATGLWTLLSGSGTIASPNQASTSISNLGSGLNRFVWTINTPGCAPKKDTIQIARSLPQTANAGQDQNVCGSTAFLSANLPTQGTGQWTLISGIGTISDANSPTPQITGLGSGQNVFRWTISNVPCPSSLDEVTIDATPGNVTAQAGQDKIVCGTTTNLNATVPTIGNGLWTLLSGSGTISQPGNPVSEITNLGPGANTFLWKVTSGNCSPTDSVVINREVETLNLGMDTVVCIGSQYLVNAGPGYTSYMWNNNTTSQTLPVSNTGNYSVLVTSQAGCSYRDSIDITFIICTHVDPLLARVGGFTVFPNPSNGQLFMKMESSQSEEGTVKIFNSQGALVYKKKINLVSGQAHEIDLQKPASGLYLVEWQSADRIEKKKVLIR